MNLQSPIIFGKRRATIVGASWDSTSQRAHIVWIDESGHERTARAGGMAIRELRKAVLDEMIHSAWPHHDGFIPRVFVGTSPQEG